MALVSVLYSLGHGNALKCGSISDILEKTLKAQGPAEFKDLIRGGWVSPDREKEYSLIIV